MKTKVITFREFAAVKKMAQIVNPLVTKKANIMKKVAALLEEVEGPTGLNVQIASMEAGIKAKFFGLGTEQLVKKVVTPAMHDDGTPILDAKTGKQLTKTTWEPLPCVVFDEEKRNYTLTVEEDSEASETVTEDTTEYNNTEAEKAQETFDAQDADILNNPFNM